LALETLPHHFELEIWKSYSLLGESTPISSPIHERNHFPSIKSFLDDEEFFEAIMYFSSLSGNLHLGSLINYLQFPNHSIGALSDSISLETIIIPSQLS
jgi:hypothetical protein